MVILIIFYITIVLIFFYTKKKFFILNYSTLFIVKKDQLNYSFFVLVIFLIFFVFFLRIFRVLFMSGRLLDLKLVFKKLLFLIELELYNYILIFLLFILILVIKNYFFIFIKFHYLRLHYYFFFRFEKFRKILKHIQNFEVFLLRKNRIFLNVFIFCKQHLFRLLIILFFLKNIIFDQFVIDLFFLPYYGFYYFLLEIYKFIFKMNFDFDIGITQCYYPDCFSVCMSGYYKIFLYQKKLFNKDYDFYQLKENIFFDTTLPKDWIIYQFPHNNDFDIFFLNNRQCFFNYKINNYLLANIYSNFMKQ